MEPVPWPITFVLTTTSVNIWGLAYIHGFKYPIAGLPACREALLVGLGDETLEPTHWSPQWP
jgi:hypothetical protein